MNVARLPKLALTLAVAGGCAGQADAPPTDSYATWGGPPKTQGSALRIEEAERNIDVGRDVGGARASLEAVLADPTLTPEQRDDARLALSRALESSGDREGAIAAVEALLAEHPGGSRFPLEETAAARLRKLVTGTDAEPNRRAEDSRQASAFAHALLRYFPTPNAAGAPVNVRILAFGGTSEVSDRLLTFDISRAIREVRREACPLCDDKLSMNTSAGRTGSWIGIARERSQLAGALVVFYFDLGEGRIPARYDADLPLPSAEVAARLERGDGLIVVKERPGAPPAVLIGAPREAQLADVEEALAAMKTIPNEPVAVALKAPLRPAEIQAVVRASFAGYRRCYEAFLKTDPTAAGTSRLRFAIRGDGVVESVSVEADAPLHDATFEGCMVALTRSLAFPATHAPTPTTVTYPVAFSPGP